ncbi:MAG: hypothetical protein ABR570_06480 [Burkholderiales bacterium]
MKLFLLASAAIVIAGCGSAAKNDAVGGAYEDDQARMNAIEQQAARVGVRVIWVNPPQRAARPDGGG